MISYAHRPEGQRWALACYGGQLAFPADGAARGEALWRDNAEVRAASPDLTALVQVRPAGLGGLDQAAADDITAYLRRQPQSAMEIAQAGQADGALALARTRLREGVAAYVDGAAGLARAQVLSAYLDGVEPAAQIGRASCRERVGQSV